MPSSPESPQDRPERARGLALIAVFKLLKAVGLVVIGALAFGLVGSDPPSTLHHWASLLRMPSGDRVLRPLVVAVTGATATKLEVIGTLAFLYAALFVTEGVGLLLQKRWAEYMTLILTVSLVPFEIYEIAEHVTAFRLLALIVNLAAVAYIALHLRRHARPHKAALA